jgi:hypothetical protein
MLINDPSFLTDYIHTFIILVICLFFTIKPFMIPEIGSLSNLYDLVAAAGARNPVPGNHNGTYLTMTSKGVSVTDHSWRLPSLANTTCFLRASCLVLFISVAISGL